MADTASRTRPARTCKFATGQDVEIQVVDFATRGMPMVWVAARVESVTPRDARLWDVVVRRADAVDRNGDGLVSAHIVGPRGGNNRIRPAA